MIKIKENIPLAPYTTIKTGGPAKYFSEAESLDDIKELSKWSKEKKIPFLILGGGSHVLISDKGFDGLVIKITTSKFTRSSDRVSGRMTGQIITADAGVSLQKIVTEAAAGGLSGLEWAIGIPGTVGGAVCNNSGAFGKSISDIVEEVKVLNIPSFEIKTFKKDDCKFEYRNSVFSVRGGKRSPDLIILSAVLLLKKGNEEEIKKTMKDFIIQRVESNPSGYSAGCYFKNIEWNRKDVNKEQLLQKFPELQKFSDKPKIAVGFLIEFLGFKGKKIGGAEVAHKHAGFIVNNGQATTEDVLNLAASIKEKISEHYGFNLEEEVTVV